MEITLVYMAAGLSSRFGGKPKMLARVGPLGETLIEYSLSQAISAGIKKAVLVVSEKTRQPIKYVLGENYKNIPINYALQEHDSRKREKPWGTVDAVCSANKYIDGPFVLCNGDDLYGKSTFKILVDHLKTNNNNATVGYKLKDVLSEKGSVNRGIFQTSEKKIISIVETLGITKDNLESKNITLNDLCSMNIFAFQKEVVDLLKIKLNIFKTKYAEDRTIECLLPNEINELIKNNQISIVVYPATERWLGLTNPEDEEIVRKELKS